MNLTKPICQPRKPFYALMDIPYALMDIPYALMDIPYALMDIPYALMGYKAVASLIHYAPGDDSPHGGILLLLCPYVRTYVRMSEFG